MSLNEQVPPPPPGQPQYPNFQAPPPQQPQGTSGLAITGFILAFVAPIIGFILSFIAIFKTGPGKAKGRGLAVAGTIIGGLFTIIGIVIIVAAGLFVSNSTVTDPGCVDGKAAIIKGAEKVDAASLQTTVDELHAAAAKAKHDEVRTAMNTMADDYTQLLNAIKTGNMPDGLEAKITTDVNKVDSLCTVGS
ncbi:DUF4190 domain-containing protein [Actinoplanes sp. NPDC051513]|uniref:DUF4190 domain-containing protein n=1 Tax=Actinoplanes sp. NPDC051513 TaxID=3363908 RepID=UPI0037BDD336